jgi:hypothetical protein
MPRRKQEEAVAERAQQILAEKGQRRKQGAEKAAQTRRQGRQAAEGEAQDQPPTTKATRAKRAPKERKPRVHADLLTVAYRGPLAGKFRKMAEQHGLSLAKLMQDALLAYEANVAEGYQPGTKLEEWKGREEAQT